jgi:formyl-CoA transferase
MKAENTTTDNIFSGLKVVDFSSFVAAPGAAVILSDFGADVIKVEPPKGELWRNGNKFPPQPFAEDAYQWHLNNRNKRGLAMDLKSPDAQKVVQRLVKWADVFIVNTPHPARKKLKLEYEDVVQGNPRLIYADLTGYGEKGPDKDLPGFDLTAYWSRSGLLSVTRDAGAAPTWPFSGTGDSPTAVVLFAAIVMGLFRRERTGKGSHVTTSLLASGAWSTSVALSAALTGAKVSLHDRKSPPSVVTNVYKTSDDVWFLLALTPDKVPALLTAVGHVDILKDPRFADPEKLAANRAQLTAIAEEIFASQPISHWREVFDKANLVYGLVRDPSDVIKDPQLQENGIVVPIEGAGGNLKFTVSSPMQVHGVTKVAAKRAPEVGEHNEEVLTELGFGPNEIEALRTSGVIRKPTAAKAA